MQVSTMHHGHIFLLGCCMAIAVFCDAFNPMSSLNLKKYGLHYLIQQQQTSCAGAATLPSSRCWISRRYNSQLFLSSYSPDDDASKDNEGNKEKKENVIPSEKFQTFLNQCTIQSFMFLLAQTRDPHTIRWLDNFTEPTIVLKTGEEEESSSGGDGVGAEIGSDFFGGGAKTTPSSKLLSYHGLEAYNTTKFTSSWDIYYAKLLQQPYVTIVVETIHNREYEIDVNPASICSRMMSVREQISREFVRDLDVIAQMGQYIFYSYWEKIKEQKEKQQQDGESGEISSEEKISKAFDRHNLIFLEGLPNDDDVDIKPSPLRKGNFDLLLLLITKEAIESILQSSLDIEGDDSVNGIASVTYLESFYKERMDSHFRGSQRYGRADDFIEELMLSSPVVVDYNVDAGGTSGGKPALVTPLRIAEIVLIERDYIAKAWKEVAMKNPEEHTGIRRLMLNQLMGGGGSSGGDGEGKNEIIETTDDFQ